MHVCFCLILSYLPAKSNDSVPRFADSLEAVSILQVQELNEGDSFYLIPYTIHERGGHHWESYSEQEPEKCASVKMSFWGMCKGHVKMCKRYIKTVRTLLL